VARPARLANLALGAWLLVAPWLLDGHSAIGAAATLAAGLLLIWLALPIGPVRNHYGAWDRVLSFRPRPRALIASATARP
jgi:hypothetical protein